MVFPAIHYKSRSLLKGAQNRTQVGGVNLRFVFSSFIRSDVDRSIILINRLVSRLSHMLLHFMNPANVIEAREFNKTPFASPHSSKVGEIKVQAKAPDRTDISQSLRQPLGELNKRLVNMALKQMHHYGGFKIPQSTAIKTVIRSPHVFKKTREQFGLTKSKHVIVYHFRSQWSAMVFINCASLLKFPAEVQIVMHQSPVRYSACVDS